MKAPSVFDSGDPEIFTLRTTAAGPSGSLPFSEDFLRTQPSGTIFGWTQNAGMGWNPAKLGGEQFLILSTQSSVLQLAKHLYTFIHFQL